MKMRIVKIVSALVTAALVGSSLGYNASAYELPNSESSTTATQLLSRSNAVQDSYAPSSMDEKYVPYPAYIDFICNGEDMLGFNVTVGSGDRIVFSDFGHAYGPVQGGSYTIEVYDKSGTKLLSTSIGGGQYVEYWGIQFYNGLSKANITVGCYMKITATNNLKARINGHATMNQKYYVFDSSGIVELNSGASEFQYPGIFSLGAQDSDFKFSTRYVSEDIRNHKVEFEKVSFDKSRFDDTYIITVTHMSGEIMYSKIIFNGDSASVADTLIQELNDLEIGFGDGINIIVIQNSQVTLNGTPIDPDLRYQFYSTQIRREEPVQRSLRYPASMYLDTSEGMSEITMEMGSDGYLKLGKGRYWSGTFDDNYTFNIHNPDGTVKGSVSVREGDDAKTGSTNIVDGLNNMRIQAGDALTVSDMNASSLHINLSAIKAGESLTFTESGIILDEFARQYSATICLGADPDAGRATFTAVVDNEGDVSFTPVFYNKNVSSTFTDIFVITVSDTNGNVKFSQHIGEGQYINYWGELLINNLNAANIKVTDHFTITGMQKHSVTVNGKALDPSKNYVFGTIGVFPR